LDVFHFLKFEWWAEPSLPGLIGYALSHPSYKTYILLSDASEMSFKILNYVFGDMKKYKIWKW